MTTVLSRLASSVLELLMPLSCAVCHREGRHLCLDCEAALPRLEKPYCPTCAEPRSSALCRWCAEMPPAIDGIRAPYLMDGVVREMVHSLKYQNLRASAPDLGRLLATFLERNPTGADVLVPVPLHRRRESERGYNQSKLLAKELGKNIGLLVETRALRRTKNSPPQVSIAGHEERRRNTEGAFECTSSMDGQRVLLIDDVVTTGSTMSACASALKAVGARSVWGLALARQG